MQTHGVRSSLCREHEEEGEEMRGCETYRIRDFESNSAIFVSLAIEKLFGLGDITTADGITDRTPRAN
jgi:hypothetical protein